MTRNTNPTRIEDKNESPSTTRNPSLTRILDIGRNPNPIRIQDVIRYPYPTRNPSLTKIEDPFDL